MTRQLYEVPLYITFFAEGEDDAQRLMRQVAELVTGGVWVPDTALNEDVQEVTFDVADCVPAEDPLDR